MTDDYAIPVREKLGGPAYTPKLNDRCVTIAEALGSAGYETMMSGKWHVGNAREAWPDRRGFSRSFCVVSGAMNYFGTGSSTLTGQPQCNFNSMENCGRRRQMAFTQRTHSRIEHCSSLVNARIPNARSFSI
jgi:arylsulfatase A-like enzyme